MLPQIFSKKTKKEKLSEEDKIRIAVSSSKGKIHIVQNYILSSLGTICTALAFIFSGKTIGIYILNYYSNAKDLTLPTVFLGNTSADASIKIYLYLALVFSILALVLPLFQNLSARNLAVQEESWLRKKILSHLFDLGGMEIPENKTGAILSTIVDGSEKVSYYLQTFYGQVFASFSVPVFTVVLISVFIDPISGITLLLCIPLIPLIVGMAQKLFRKVSSKSRNARVRLAGQYLEAIQGIVTLRLLNAHKVKESELAEYGENNRKAIMSLLASNQLIIFVVDAVFSLFSVTITTFLATYRLYTGSIAIDSAIALILVSIVFMEPLDQAAAFFYVGMGGMASKRKIQEIFRMKTYKDLDHESNSYMIYNIMYHKDDNKVVSVNNLSFKYNVFSNKNILDNLTFDVYKGEKIAIVGPSGNGKSTLIKILKGYLLPTQGSVIVKNIPLGLENIDIVRQNSAFVSQSTWLFNMSIKDNLLLSKPNASEEQIWDALEKAYIASEIKSLPMGLDTIVGEQGISISGGQAQRLSIARAFLSDRDILIFDEPTSQIDLISEKKILESIRNIPRDKTLIMVTHRPNNLGSVNRIFHIENAKLRIETVELKNSDGISRCEE